MDTKKLLQLFFSRNNLYCHLPRRNFSAFITSCYYVLFDSQKKKIIAEDLCCIFACHQWAHLLSSKTLTNYQSKGQRLYVIRNQNGTIFTFYGANRKLINLFPGKLTSLELWKAYSWTLQHQIRLVNIGQEFRPFRSKSEAKPLSYVSFSPPARFLRDTWTWKIDW